MVGLIEGRIVHYVLPRGRSVGAHRPAIVVRVWNEVEVNLQVFTDRTNDFVDDGASGMLWVTSVAYSETKEPGTWHWIEKV